MARLRSLEWNRARPRRTASQGRTHLAWKVREKEATDYEKELKER